VYGALLSVLLLGEALHGYQVVAGLVVLFGLWLARSGGAARAWFSARRNAAMLR
jgi:drug/metabolite transporter (DMT)-like permease